MTNLFLSHDRSRLHDGRRSFDPWALAWGPPEGALPEGSEISPEAAVSWLYGEAKGRRVPVGVIGPREASPREIEVAEALGRRLGALGVPVLNGGKTGVMEAISKGCMESGGDVFGFIPDEDWRCANLYVTVPLATGIGPARNVLIARASLALIAIGGEYGTLSEMALGLHFDKPVFALENAPHVDGALSMDGVEEVVAALLPVILHLEK
ncbi:MAG: TIGR00725 family protein [Hyphomicrobiales bacterium]|nr:MAG: TIGR00725 family protein [Hyphomicrobiales bacterium]